VLLPPARRDHLKKMQQPTEKVLGQLIGNKPVL
jgi:hypothetical protein